MLLTYLLTYNFLFTPTCWLLLFPTNEVFTFWFARPIFFLFPNLDALFSFITYQINHIPFLCFHRLANIYSIRKHMTLKHLNTPQKCNLCNKVYANKNSLHRHKKLHEDSKRTDKGFRIKCLVCSKAFRFKFNMKVHLIILIDQYSVELVF